MELETRPVGSLSGEHVHAALLMADRAPSVHDSRPWRFRCTPGAIEVHADLERALPATDPDHRELVLACGAALLNLRLAISTRGVYPEVRTNPDRSRPNLMALVRPGGHSPVTPLEERLARVIGSRRTDRRPVSDGAVPEPVRYQLRHAAEVERAWLAVVAPHQLPRLRALARQAHRIQRADRAFGAERDRWAARGSLPTADGVTATGNGSPPEPGDNWVVPQGSAGPARPRAAGMGLEGEPLVAVIGSFHDLPSARLQAGQAMQRVLLTAAAAGLPATFLSELVEVAPVRERLRQLIGGGLWPQTVLRIG